MKDYSNFTATELAMDDDFMRWVAFGANGDAWDNWILQNPRRIEIVNEAIHIIRAVEHDKKYVFTPSKAKNLWGRINSSIELSNRKNELSGLLRYDIAAALALIIITGLTLFQITFQNGFDEAGLRRYTNASDQLHTLVLNDGSVVTLYPNSSLRYPGKFTSTRREVYLSGEAFFKVTRDTHRPFTVYASEIVTNVLGTSFNIRAVDKEKDIVVSVKTGKVSVSTRVEQARNNKDQTRNREGVLITRNQQVVYSRKNKKMNKGLVSEPVLNTPVDLVFKDTSVSEIFSQLEKAYGIDIIFDDEIMDSCRLTVSLNDTSFFDKLRLICKGINAQYEILDAHIIVTGSGCG